MSLFRLDDKDGPTSLIGVLGFLCLDVRGDLRALGCTFGFCCLGGWEDLTELGCFPTFFGLDPFESSVALTCGLDVDDIAAAFSFSRSLFLSGGESVGEPFTAVALRTAIACCSVRDTDFTLGFLHVSFNTLLDIVRFSFLADRVFLDVGT